MSLQLPRSVILKEASRLYPDHLYFVCNCNRHGCQFCDGGLASCVICNGFEGTLPRNCPGIELTPMQREQIYRGELDFKDGEWHAVDN